MPQKWNVDRRGEPTEMGRRWSEGFQNLHPEKYQVDDTASQPRLRTRRSLRVSLTWLALDSFPLANKANSLPTSKYQLTIQHLFPFDGQTKPREMKIFIAVGAHSKSFLIP